MRTPEQQRAYDHGFTARGVMKDADPQRWAATVETDTKFLGPVLAEHYLDGWWDRQARDGLQWALERNDQIERIEAIWRDMFSSPSSRSSGDAFDPFDGREIT